ncbi:hypothetical protein [Bacterioplanoides sp.]|uniref:hypothetical protein n=1 Tax=Bacterioplanoides sp. TaxID=2066072 RepID=UPI003B002A8B
MSNSKATCYLLAGAPQSGKHTAGEALLSDFGPPLIKRTIFEMVNPDSTEAEISEKVKAALLRQAEEDGDFIFLSSLERPEDIDRIGDIKAAGVEIVMLVVGLESLDLYVVRSSRELSEGDVKIGVAKSHAGIKNAMPLCDGVIFYDNSRLLSSTVIDDDTIEIEPDLNLQACIEAGELTELSENVKDWVREFID